MMTVQLVHFSAKKNIRRNADKITFTNPEVTLIAYVAASRCSGITRDLLEVWARVYEQPGIDDKPLVTLADMNQCFPMTPPPRSKSELIRRLARGG